MKALHQITTEELEAGRPNVEERLTNAEQTLSLFTIPTRALGQAEDLALFRDRAKPGWAFASDLLADALADVHATKVALPGKAVLVKAPHRRG